MKYSVGLSKNEIPVPEFNIGLMGYGVPFNIAKTQATPLFSRSVVICDNEGSFTVFCVTEIAFVSMALKDAVLKDLQTKLPEKKITHANVLLSAQHTHSAPGGFSHFPFYNFTIPGFRPKTFDAIKKTIVASIIHSFSSLKPATISHRSTQVPVDVPIAVNRSLRAFKNNPEFLMGIFNPANPIDRTMNELLIQDEQSNILGCINLFGVHCTSVPNTNTAIHHDNKGVAALLWEEKHPGSIALFAQASAGDVSPNYIYDEKTKHMRGPSQDGFSNASFNGKLQFQASVSMNTHGNLSGSISALQCFKNFSHGCTTPAHGLAFFKGTLDGRGISDLGAFFVKLPCFLYALYLKLKGDNKKFLEQQGNKEIVLDHNRMMFLGIYYKFLKFLKFIPDPTIKELALQIDRGALKTSPWVPTHLPLQIIRIGQITILSVPGEITTMSAHRLKKEIQPLFPNSTLLVWSYCNAYMGYITTPEEYDVQCYEGGHTIYGKNTLPYLIDCFKALAQNISVTDRPWSYPQEELALRSYT